MRAIALVLVAAAACSSDPSSRDVDAGAEPADAAPAGSWWTPGPGTSWQWQLSGTIDTSLDVAMYDVDLVETPDSVLAALRAQGRRVVCYFSAGSHEKGRTDLGDIPAAAIGKVLDGWPDEHWFDVRHPKVRAVITSRLDRAVARGCDAVEPDNVDGYSNDSGFPLTAADQLDFNRFIAREAHARRLSVGLKNDLDQIPELVADFDWALDEECFQYDECDGLGAFVRAGKAVFQVEYGDAKRADAVCADANRRNFDTLIKNLDLDAWRVACR